MFYLMSQINLNKIYAIAYAYTDIYMDRQTFSVCKSFSIRQCFWNIWWFHLFFLIIYNPRLTGWQLLNYKLKISRRVD